MRDLWPIKKGNFLLSFIEWLSSFANSIVLVQFEKNNRRKRSDLSPVNYYSIYYYYYMIMISVVVFRVTYFFLLVRRTIEAS